MMGLVTQASTRDFTCVDNENQIYQGCFNLKTYLEDEIQYFIMRIGLEEPSIERATEVDKEYFMEVYADSQKFGRMELGKYVDDCIKDIHDQIHDDFVKVSEMRKEELVERIKSSWHLYNSD